MCNRGLLPSGSDVVTRASAPWRLSTAALVIALHLCSLLGNSGAQPTNLGTKRPDLFRAGESSRKPSKAQTASVTPSPQRQRPGGPTEITAQGSSEFDNAAR